MCIYLEVSYKKINVLNCSYFTHDKNVHFNHKIKKKQPQSVLYSLGVFYLFTITHL